MVGYVGISIEITTFVRKICYSFESRLLPRSRRQCIEITVLTMFKKKKHRDYTKAKINTLHRNLEYMEDIPYFYAEKCDISRLMEQSLWLLAEIVSLGEMMPVFITFIIYLFAYMVVKKKI